MTLEQWSAKSGLVVSDHNGAKFVPNPNGNRFKLELWRLADYRVSSVACGGIWLTKR